MPEPQTLAVQSAGANPLVLLLLALGWPTLLCLAAVRLRRALRERLPDGGTVTVPLIVTLAVGLTAILAFSPRLPVLSTYTGLAHIVSAYRVADLEWHWSFPTDYPLALPVLAAGLVKLVGRNPGAWALMSLLLTLFGCAGTVLLAAAMLRSRTAALAAGIAAATLPPVLLLARADSLSVGYFALSPWVLLFALDRTRRADDRGGGPERPPDAERRGRMVERAGLAVSLFLLVQTRPEAVAFLLVPLALPFLVGSTPISLAARLRRWGRSAAAELGRTDEARAGRPESTDSLPGEQPPRSGPTGFWSVGLPVLLALILLAPYLASFAARLGEGGGGDLGFNRVPRMLGGTALLALLLAVPALVTDLGRRFDGTAVVGGLALTTALCAAGLAFFGARFLLPGTVPWFEGGETLRTVPFWHFNPKVIPLSLIFLAAVGLWGGSGPGERTVRLLLVLWLGGVVAAASTKATGELPFEGLRTQLPATVPFALLVGAGADRALRGFAGLHWRGIVLGAPVLPFFPLTLPLVTDLDYDQQQEYRFLASCLPEIPERTTLHVPADVVPVLLPGDTDPLPVDLFTLYRSGYLLDAFGDEARGSRIAPVDAGFGSDPPAWFFLGLSCYRTGTPRVTPSCLRVLEGFRLEPVCEADVANRPYTSDFISGTAIASPEVRIGIYRAWGRARSPAATGLAALAADHGSTPPRDGMTAPPGEESRHAIP
ncbi:MAG: hypothetical protein FJ109_01650 [Deltaproteobacteria bacterium]|nr:hypothetical protein [Deltaproteobacteria bacterium]